MLLVNLWLGFPYMFLVCMGALQGIPEDVNEAAVMDGANPWQVFRRITAPLLAPVLMVVFVTMVINVLKVFDLVFIISQSAGANQKYSDVLATQLYQSYGLQQYGAASAIGVVLVLLVLPMMIINIRRFRREGR